MLKEFANSFLVVSSLEDQGSQGERLLAQINNLGKRSVRTACETKFFKERANITTRKAYISEHDGRQLSFAVGEAKILHVLQRDSYHHGELEAARILRALLRNSRPKRYSASFMPWAKFLFSQANAKIEKTDNLEDFYLDGRLLDATPFNCVNTSSGLKWIDLEWIADKPIPLGWVVMRGIDHTHLKLRTAGAGGNAKRTLSLVLKGLGLKFSIESLAKYRELENIFQRGVIE